MASIDIPCANPDCSSENVSIRHSVETRPGVFEHRFDCEDCRTTFVISTQLIVVSVPKKEMIN